MNIQEFINNFPWNMFGHAYGNALDLKEPFVKINNGTANFDDYQFIISRIAYHQVELYNVTPLMLKLIIALLGGEASDKKHLLEHIRIIYETANFYTKINIIEHYKPSNKTLKRYYKIKKRLFDKELAGKIEQKIIKMYNSLDFNFFPIIALDYILYYKPFLESFVESKDKETSEMAKLLVNSINNPKKYKFFGREY